MKKLICDFLYYLRQGHGFRKAWNLARVTL